MGKIRVLHVIWSGATGGIQMQVAHLCRAQAGNADLDIALLICKKEEGSHRLGLFRHAPYPVHEGGLRSGSDMRRLRRADLGRLFDGFDIIHLHVFHPLVARAAWRSGKKLLFSIHGNFGFSRRRRLSEYLSEYLLKRFLHHRVNFISYNSGFSKDVSMRRYRLAPDAGRLAPNGIDFAGWMKSAGPPDELLVRQTKPAFVVGVVSRFAEVKRIDRLLHVFRRFAEGREVRLLLVGDGPCRAAYEKMIDASGLREKVILTGFRRDTWPLHQLMHVEVLPSVNEAFGLVVIEGFFAGNPVLVYDDGGAAADVVRQIEKDDVASGDDQLLGRLDYYYRNRKAIEGGVNGRREYALTFGIERTEKSFYGIYQFLTYVRH